MAKQPATQGQVSHEQAIESLNRLQAEEATRFAQVLQALTRSGASRVTRHNAKNKASKHSAKPQVEFYTINYPYGHDIIRRNCLHPEGVPNAEGCHALACASGDWLGIVLEGNVAITTSQGLSATNSWRTPPEFSGGTMLLDQTCLEYRTTIWRVLAKGEMFLLWELASKLSAGYFSNRSGSPANEPYSYELVSGQGPLLVVWALGSVKPPPQLLQQANFPVLHLGYQLPRFNSILITDLIAPTHSGAMTSTVLWVKVTELLDHQEFREFVFAYAWRQSEAHRELLARHVRSEQLIRACFGNAKAIDTDYQVPFLASTLCYLDDALTGVVPLYRFVDNANDPYWEMAADVKQWLKRPSHQPEPSSFLLVPRVDAEGGMLSLSIPVSPGAIPWKEAGHTANWKRWADAFGHIWGKWKEKSAQGLREAFTKLHEWHDGGKQLIAQTMGSRGTTYSSRNCPFLRAWVELAAPSEVPVDTQAPREG